MRIAALTPVNDLSWKTCPCRGFWIFGGCGICKICPGCASCCHAKGLMDAPTHLRGWLACCCRPLLHWPPPRLQKFEHCLAWGEVEGAAARPGCLSHARLHLHPDTGSRSGLGLPAATGVGLRMTLRHGCVKRAMASSLMLGHVSMPDASKTSVEFPAALVGLSVWFVMLCARLIPRKAQLTTTSREWDVCVHEDVPAGAPHTLRLFLAG